MRKILTTILVILLLTGMTACQNQTVTDKDSEKKNSLEIMVEMFDRADMNIFEISSIIDREAAENKLNMLSSMIGYQGKIVLDGYQSGVISNPMMSPSTSMVAVFEFDEDTDPSQYEEAVKNLMFAAICVGPEEENVHVETKDNYLVYISAAGPEEDEGLKLLAALEDISTSEAYADCSDELTAFVMDYYILEDNKEKIREITKDQTPYYGLIAYEEETDFEMEDFVSAYRLSSGIDYEAGETTNAYFTYILEISDINDLDKVKEKVTAVAADKESNAFRISEDATLNISSDGSFIILEAR